MPEGCDPYIYYTRVRPYIFGTKNNPAVPNGVVYEGCYDGKAQFFRGETGAQSGIVPTLDGLLGVRHQDDPLKEYLLEMRDYMPPAHRRFLERVENESKVRSRVEQNRSHGPLVEAYNACFDELYAFRAKHLEYAASYIRKQSAQSNNSTAVGTGGTPFMTYLAKHRDETRIEAQNAMR
jgi:indoleamine 2,3-dioxygenase